MIYLCRTEKNNREKKKSKNSFHNKIYRIDKPREK